MNGKKLIHRNRQVIWLNVVFWTGMFLAHFYIQYNPKTGFDTWPETITFVYGTLINIIAIYSFARWGAPAYKDQPAIRNLLKYNLAFITILVVGESLIDIVYHWYREDFYQIGIRDWAYVRGVLFTNFIFTLFIMAMANLYALSLSWLRDTQRRELEEKEKLKAELALMKHQVQPHFLFNTLNNLFGLACEAGNEKVADGISKLAGIMRYMTYETAAEQVKLSQEVQYLQSYIDLQRLRIGDQLDIYFEFEGTPTTQQISPLLLLPFVENAFKHGISFVDPSPINISLNLKGDTLFLTVKNKIYPKKEKLEAGGFGLENVKQRLELIYPDNHTLEIKEENGFYEVDLCINEI